MEKKISDDVVRVFCEFVRCDPPNDAEQKLLRDKIGGDAGDNFRERKEALQPEAHLEDEMYLSFVE